MTSGSDTTNGWYLLKQGVQYGPYRWEQLAGYAREGTLVPADLVWHPSLPAWAPAATIAGLDFQSGAPAPPGPPPSPPPTTSPSLAAAPLAEPSPAPHAHPQAHGPSRTSFIRRRRLPLSVAAGVVVVLAVVLGIVFGVLRSDSPVAELTAEQGPLLPADVPARTIPLKTGGALVIPEGALPEETQISSRFTEFPLLPEGVEGLGSPVAITASEEPSGPVIIRLPIPPGAFDPSDATIIRVQSDGTTTFLMTGVEGDELVAATPGLSTFAVGLLDRGMNVTLVGVTTLLFGQREVYHPLRVSPAALGQGTWTLAGPASLIYESNTAAIVQAGDELGRAWLRYEAVDLLRGRRWSGITWISVAEDLYPLLPDAGEFAASFVTRTPIVYAGEDVVFTAGVHGQFQGPITWSWDFGDGQTGEVTTDANVTRYELPVKRYEPEDLPKTYWAQLSVQDAQGRQAAAGVIVQVVEKPLSVTLEGRERLSFIDPAIVESYTARVSGGPPSANYRFSFQLLPGEKAESEGAEASTRTFTFDQPGEYLLRVEATELGAKDDAQSALARLPITVTGGEPLSASILGLPTEAEPGESLGAQIEVRGGVLVVSGRKGGYTLEVNWGDPNPPLVERDLGVAVRPSEGVTVPLSHTYAQAGTYTVTITATDVTGTSVSDSRTITVGGPVMSTTTSTTTTTARSSSTTQPAAGTSVLRFEGMYRSDEVVLKGEAGSKFTDYYHYLRFYEDGTVVAMTTAWTPSETFAALGKKSAGTSEIGSYRLDGGSLVFSTAFGETIFDYKGVATGDILTLNWQDNRSGKQGQRGYHFVPLSG